PKNVLKVPVVLLAPEKIPPKTFENAGVLNTRLPPRLNCVATLTVSAETVPLKLAEPVTPSVPPKLVEPATLKPPGICTVSAPLPNTTVLLEPTTASAPMAVA